MRRLRQTAAQGAAAAARPAVILLTGARRAFLGGAEVHLTPMEYSLLEVLVQNRDLVLSRDRLLDLVWGFDFAGGTRTVDIHISRLRAKLGLQTEIETVFKYGYRLTGDRVQLQDAAENRP